MNAIDSRTLTKKLGRCTAITKHGHRCTYHAALFRLCTVHFYQRQTKERRRARRAPAFKQDPLHQQATHQFNDFWKTRPVRKISK